MRFTELLKEIQATYPEESRAFHVLATRYYLGVDTRDMLAMQVVPVSEWARPVLTGSQVNTIIYNR